MHSVSLLSYIQISPLDSYDIPCLFVVIVFILVWFGINFITVKIVCSIIVVVGLHPDKPRQDSFDITTTFPLSGWHHRLNLKAGMIGLGLYRLVLLLRREAELVAINMTAEDLERDVSRGATVLERRLQEAIGLVYGW